jgi:predicted nucleic acid-binding protein
MAITPWLHYADPTLAPLCRSVRGSNVPISDTAPQASLDPRPMSLVIADTSVWIAHFRKPNRALQTLLSADQVLCHPMVLIEIACGTPPAPRERTLSDLGQLRSATVASTDETLALIEREQLQDSGCGAIDLLLLGSVLLTSDALLWTLDKNLRTLAARFDISFG